MATKTPTLHATSLMPPEDVERAIRILSEVMPGDSRKSRGPQATRDPFRSCISCMLSAQSLDRNTRAATRALFALARTPEGILRLSDAELVNAIRPAGLYNMKARNIRNGPGESAFICH